MGGFLARVLEGLVADGHATPPDVPERTVTLLPGLSFDLPGHPSHWEAQPRSAPDDDYDAHCRDTFATTSSVVIRDARASRLLPAPAPYAGRRVEGRAEWPDPAGPNGPETPS